ncbi:PepSY domain-containing protein [Cytobacillus purgationiresistens]|uniref:Membrane protein YkoI n=1 Tax=Cytobacillus purgationiresistens TaxID=863449 RepID=A0ABU0AHX6_9BACI|nr:PepSY domain-containing protein [Cytobacillus purgationiresistens]MDQ0270854.1 putative membrane protein YkoI [Cytobacillus purgationiresistens]
MRNKMVIGLLAAGVILGGAAAVGATGQDSKVNTPKANDHKELITMDKVKEIALKKQAGEIESIELESHLGTEYYDVEIENGKIDYDIHIDAMTGKVLSVKEDHDGDYDDVGETGSLSSKDLLPEQEALKIAEKAVNGKVVEMKLDKDDGLAVYEFELKTDRGEAEVEINAVTGEVLDLENDLDD